MTSDIKAVTADEYLRLMTFYVGKKRPHLVLEVAAPDYVCRVYGAEYMARVRSSVSETDALFIPSEARKRVTKPCQRTRNWQKYGVGPNHVISYRAPAFTAVVFDRLQNYVTVSAWLESPAADNYAQRIVLATSLVMAVWDLHDEDLFLGMITLDNVLYNELTGSVRFFYWKPARPRGLFAMSRRKYYHGVFPKSTLKRRYNQPYNGKGQKAKCVWARVKVGNKLLGFQLDMWALYVAITHILQLRKKDIELVFREQLSL